MLSPSTTKARRAVSGTKLVLLSAGCIAALALGDPAFAQTDAAPAAQAQDDTGGDIVVTGFRSSLASALDAKRKDIRITDGISAEDIGKFPAQNITEAIQRIAGVQMSNINGRGSTISIRGLGAQYARTTINGQTFASADFKDGFRYDIIQTDLASAIQVVKSPTADMDTGGLSGTVNIDTVKPLAYKGPRFIVGVKGYNSEYRGKEWTPKVSGAYIDSFAGGTLGVMANVSYQKLKDRGDYVFIKNWYQPGQVVADAVVPGNIRYRRIDRDTEQLMASGALQWKPSDNFEALLQGEYSRDHTRYTTRQMVFGRWQPGAVTVNSVKNGMATNISISSFNVDNNTQPELRNLKTQAYTGTINWQPGERWKVHAVAHYTKGDAALYEWATIDEIRFANGGTLDVSDPSNVKWSTASLTDGSMWNSANRTWFAFVDGATHIQSAKDKAAQLDVTRDLDWHGIQSLAVGAKYHHESFATNAYRHDRDADVADPVKYPEYAWIPNLGTTGQLVDNFLGGAMSIPHAFLSVNADEWQRILASKGITVPDVPDWPSTYRVDRYVPAVYAMANVDTQIGGMALRGNLGVRYEHTRQNVTASVTDGTGSGSALLGQQHVIQNYGNVLPSASFALDLTPKLVARFAAAKVLVRPLLNSQTQMADTISTGQSQGRRFTSVSEGESRLKPLTANQLDLSLEFYHGRGNSVSIAGFYKAVKNGTFTQFYCPSSYNGVALNGIVTDCQSADRTADYSFSRVLNDGRTIHIKGVEFSASENFDAILPVKGFGATGNVTLVDTNSSALGTGFNLRDLSKFTANITPYWENEMFSVRFSVNHRSAYKQDAASSFFVNSGEIHTVRARTQMDLALGFTPNKWLNFTGGIINLNDTHEDAYQTTADTFQMASRTGRTFYLSATTKF
ncbi:TonB-dependent receptor [Sphingomonas sp. ABOLD]|uniref:TonB-dependent receptor n=1 Tax=Sphingomonas trueperi TaxID=53317 RepID=A0A7X5XYZ9_9SPHN|nr:MULTISPECIES: TonB-dependent receptor [unclassified Sphingomonas]NJB96710.1 TonB-dependent receptor [Sphingomonas trueperi]RSV34481.1 TonB-dependent receptor [Sphingomonas sp. ABOLE]RSV51997.1 TonB-dependent receptor [Sphingomonas sp. ABOLD]